MNRIEILDGAMGSELILNGETLPNYIWSAKANLTNPDLVYEIHRKYIEQGANYITTNTFRTTPRAFEKAGFNKRKAKESFDSAIQIAKKASNGKAKILGSLETSIQDNSSTEE